METCLAQRKFTQRTELFVGVFFFSILEKLTFMYYQNNMQSFFYIKVESLFQNTPSKQFGAQV